MSPLTVFTSQPEGYPAKAFADYLAAQQKCLVQVRPLSAMPPAPSWAERHRQHLLDEQQELHQALNLLKVALVMAADDPRRYEGHVALWQDTQARHTRRLADIEQELAQEPGPDGQTQVRFASLSAETQTWVARVLKQQTERRLGRASADAPTWERVLRRANLTLVLDQASPGCTVEAQSRVVLDFLLCQDVEEGGLAA